MSLSGRFLCALVPPALCSWETHVYVSMPPSLVIFCGGPFSGKSWHYQQHFSQTHARVAFEPQNPAARHRSLHSAIKEVLRLLQQGTNVVFDGQNGSAQARQHFIAKAQKEVPSLRVTGLYFEPRVPLPCLYQSLGYPEITHFSAVSAYSP